MLGSTSSFLYIVGSLCIAKFLFTLVAELYRALLSPGPALKKYGEWAVVTGATDGIGKAIAFELVRKGMHVLLISRSAAKLQAVKSELVSEHKEAMVETLEVDFSALSADRRVAVEKAVGGKDVGVLVNNVGISYAFAQWFDELTDAEVQSLISLNVESTTWMTRAVLPGMLQRQRGVVVNMSSAAARSPLPLLAQYSAAKGYIENLTRSLAAEYATKGVAFQCQSPLWVATAMTFPGSKVPIDERATLLTPSATTFARASVARIGNGVMVSPYWAHGVYCWAVQHLLPDWLMIRLALKLHKQVRFHPKNKQKMEEKKTK